MKRENYWSTYVQSLDWQPKLPLLNVSSWPFMCNHPLIEVVESTNWSKSLSAGSIQGGAISGGGSTHIFHIQVVGVISRECNLVDPVWAVPTKTEIWVGLVLVQVKFGPGFWDPNRILNAFFFGLWIPGSDRPGTHPDPNQLDSTQIGLEWETYNWIGPSSGTIGYPINLNLT